MLSCKVLIFCEFSDLWHVFAASYDTGLAPMQVHCFFLFQTTCSCSKSWPFAGRRGTGRVLSYGRGKEIHSILRHKVCSATAWPSFKLLNQNSKCHTPDSLLWDAVPFVIHKYNGNPLAEHTEEPMHINDFYISKNLRTKMDSHTYHRADSRVRKNL